jgi:hypothetical protein
VGTASSAVGAHELAYDHDNYDTAYGWGDHAGLYDPVGTAASEVGSHEGTYNHANYNTAYGWGDHAGLYDPVGTASSEVGAHELAYDHSQLHAQNTDTGTTGNTFTVDSDSTTGKIVLDVALGAADKSLTITNDALTDNRTATFPNASGTVAFGTGTANKLVKWSATNAIGDATNTDAEVSGAVSASHTQNTDTGTTGNTFTIDSDSTTGKIIVDVALGAADKSLTLTNDALTDNRTITFPNNTGTVALTSDIPSSFDNISEGNSKVKVIDAGTGYVSIYIDGAEKYRLDASGIADTSGNEILKFAFNASAVNEIAVANAATTSKPKISTEGGDTDIGLELATKGTGQLDVIVGATQRFYVSATEAGTNSADLNIDGVLKIGATQVLTNQQAAIADIADTIGPANDGTARAMCNTILALLRTHGLIAT